MRFTCPIAALFVVLPALCNGAGRESWSWSDNLLLDTAPAGFDSFGSLDLPLGGGSIDAGEGYVGYNTHVQQPLDQHMVSSPFGQHLDASWSHDVSNGLWPDYQHNRQGGETDGHLGWQGLSIPYEQIMYEDGHGSIQGSHSERVDGRRASTSAVEVQQQQQQVQKPRRTRQSRRKGLNPATPRAAAAEEAEAFRQWLARQWNERGMSVALPAQTLAEAVAELKILFPEYSCILGKESSIMVHDQRGFQDEVYMYDYQMWTYTYKTKINNLKRDRSHLSPEELHRELLASFRNVNAKHHATLADPQAEAAQVAKSREVFDAFTNDVLQYEHDPLSIHTIARASLHYVYPGMDHQETSKFIKKYLINILKMKPREVDQLELLHRKGGL